MYKRQGQTITGFGIFSSAVVLAIMILPTITSLSKMCIRDSLIPSGVHPVVLREGGMSGAMGMTVAVCLAGLMLVGFALYRFRFRQVRLQERLQALKDEVEVLEERR